MGVKGLWQLLEPAGRRINIEALQNKKLAVGAQLHLQPLPLGCALFHPHAALTAFRHSPAEGPMPMQMPPSGCSSLSRRCVTTEESRCMARWWRASSAAFAGLVATVAAWRCLMQQCGLAACHGICASAGVCSSSCRA